MNKSVLFALLLLPALSFAGTMTFYPVPPVAVPATGIVFDSSTLVNRVPSGTSPLVFSLTIGSGSNRFLAVGCGGLGANDAVTGVTVGGFAMTRSTSAVEPITAVNSVIYTYIAPPSGAQTISATTFGGVTNNTKCVAAAFSGVDQSAPVEFSTGTWRSAGSLYQKPTLTTVTNNDALFNVISDGNDDALAPTETGQASLGKTNVDGYIVLAGSTRPVTTAGSWQIGWSGVSPGAVESAIAIKPAP